MSLFAVIVSVFFFARLIYNLLRDQYGSTPLDEILIVCVGLFVPFGLRFLVRDRSGISFIFFFAAYIVTVFLSSMYYPYSFERGSRIFYMGLALDVKFFALFFGAYALALDSVFKGDSIRSISVILYALIIVACVNSVQVIQDALGDGVGFSGVQLSMRGPFYRPAGYFHNPVTSAQVILYGFLAALALASKRFTLARLSLAAFLFVMVLIHFSVKEILIACSSLMLFVLMFVRSDMLTKTFAALVGVALVGSVLASAAGDQVYQRISYYSGEEGADSVRRVLYSASVDIANDMAPFGSGTSTFGSQGSRTEGYSSLYFTYGVYGRWGASKDNDNFLLDTFWPKILAESGFIGLLFFAFTVIILMRSSYRLMMNTRSPEDAFLFTGMGGVLVISAATGALGEEFSGSIFYLLGAMALARASILVPIVNRRAKGRRRSTARRQPLVANATRGMARSPGGLARRQEASPGNLTSS